MNRRNESFGQERESVTAKQEVKKPGVWKKFLDKFGMGDRWQKEVEYLESIEPGEDQNEEQEVNGMLIELSHNTAEKVVDLTQVNKVDLSRLEEDLKTELGPDNAEGSALLVEVTSLVDENAMNVQEFETDIDQTRPLDENPTDLGDDANKHKEDLTVVSAVSKASLLRKSDHSGESGPLVDYEGLANFGNVIPGIDIEYNLDVVEQPEKESSRVELEVTDFFGKNLLELWDTIQDDRAKGLNSEESEQRVKAFNEELQKCLFNLQTVGARDAHVFNYLFDYYFSYYGIDEQVDSTDKISRITDSVSDVDNPELSKYTRDKSFMALPEEQKMKDANYVKILRKFYKDKSLDGNLDEKQVAVFLDILKANKEGIFYQARELFRDSISKSVAEFKDSMIESINNGDLPISQDELEKRMKNLTFGLVDPLISTLQGASGAAYHSLGQTHIDISTLLYGEEIKSTVFHELLHAISGKSNNHGEDSGSDKVVDKIGLSFSPQKGEGIVYNDFLLNRFSWLNEAMTENLTMEFDVQKNGEDIPSEKRSYLFERKLLAKLIKNGISDETLRQAYFEQYKLTEPGEHRQPNMQKMFKEVGDKFYKGFFVDLDDYISFITQGGDDGVQVAFEEWERIGDEFTDVLREWKKGRVEEKRKNKKK